jgi:hypothetical protein
MIRGSLLTGRGALAILVVLAQVGFLLAVPALAVAAPCAAAAAPTGGGAPPPDVLPVLPQSGGGGAVEFCMRDPAACKTGGPAPGFSPAPEAASVKPPSFGTVLAYVGSAPGRGHGTLLMLALAPRQAACDPSVPTGPGTPPATPVPCPPPPPAPIIDGRAVAVGLAIPWPDLQVGVNPAQRGLAGLPTRFWVAGYDGAPLTASTRVRKDGIPGPPGCPGGPAAVLDVTVQASVTGYTWDFGDGLPTSELATDDRGRAYPQVSAIQHAYSQVSASGFPVTLTAHFALSYRAGGGWQPLSGADRTATITYRVQQAVPVVVNQG